MSARGVMGWQRAMAGDREGLTQVEQAQEELIELTGRDPYSRPSLWVVDACIALGEFRRAEDYLDQALMLARERTTLFVPELALHLARVRHLPRHPRQHGIAPIQPA